MSENTAECVYYVPTWRERAWRRLGFGFHLGDEPEGVEPAWEGWSRTVTIMRFSFVDRLRLLLRGELKVETTSYYDAPSPSKVKNRIDWQILPPASDRSTT